MNKPFSPDNSACEWLVWEDWISEDVLAVEAKAMTVALTKNLAHERVEVLSVQAPNRATAVRIAFPNRFKKDKPCLIPRRH